MNDGPAARRPATSRWRHPPDLAIRHVAGATLVPLSPEPDPQAAMRFRIGVFGPDGAPVEESIHWRGGFAANPPPFAEPAESWDGDFVYGGQLWNHFGHFLLEGLSRAWALADLPGPILWQRRAADSALLPWQADIFARLGLAAREHRVVDRPVRVERLAVPVQGLVTRRYLHPRQEKALAVHPYRRPEAGRRVWLSRSRLPPKLSHVEGEAALEAALRAEQWTVLHPEAMTVDDQLAALEAAEVIAGFEGSAFHGLLLGRAVRARIVIVSRGARTNPNYHMIADMKGLDQRVIGLDLDHVAGQGTTASYRLRDAGVALDALRDAAAG